MSEGVGGHIIRQSDHLGYFCAPEMFHSSFSAFWGLTSGCTCYNFQLCLSYNLIIKNTGYCCYSLNKFSQRSSIFTFHLSFEVPFGAFRRTNPGRTAVNAGPLCVMVFSPLCAAPQEAPHHIFITWKDNLSLDFQY